MRVYRKIETADRDEYGYELPRGVRVEEAEKITLTCADHSTPSSATQQEYSCSGEQITPAVDFVCEQSSTPYPKASHDGGQNNVALYGFSEMAHVTTPTNSVFGSAHLLYSKYKEGNSDWYSHRGYWMVADEMFSIFTHIHICDVSEAAELVPLVTWTNFDR